MAFSSMGGPRPDRRSTVTARQLTIGECIAIARYGRVLVDEHGGDVPMWELLAFIDRIGVCTTCGWSKAVHEAEESSALAGVSCKHYSRGIVSNSKPDPAA